MRRYRSTIKQKTQITIIILRSIVRDVVHPYIQRGPRTNNNNNNNGEFLYSAHTMLCALHTYYPWSLDLFIHVPFQLSFWSIQHLQPFRR